LNGLLEIAKSATPLMFEPCPARCRAISARRGAEFHEESSLESDPGAASRPRSQRLRVSDDARRRILNPERGAALARARDYGIDLTVILHNMTLTPDELLDNVVRAQSFTRQVRQIRGESDDQLVLLELEAIREARSIIAAESPEEQRS